MNDWAKLLASSNEIIIIISFLKNFSLVKLSLFFFRFLLSYVFTIQKILHMRRLNIIEFTRSLQLSLLAKASTAFDMI